MTAKTLTWTATPQQFERLIAAVLPHASTDRYLPVINCVSLEIEGHAFLAVATDRYSLGIARADLSEWDETAKKARKTVAQLRPDDLRRVFAFLRPHKTFPVRWGLTDDALTVETGSGDRLTVRTVQEVNFPNWRAIFEQRVPDGPQKPVPHGFTARIVDHFNATAKALGEERMSWHFAGPEKATLIQVGDEFLGLIIPRRTSEDAELDFGQFGVERKAVAA